MTAKISTNIEDQLLLGRQPIHLATAIGATDVVINLINSGSDVNSKDKNEETPLHIAAKSGHLDIVAILVARGADVNTENKDGHTPLYLSIMNKNPKMVKMLLGFGIYPNVTEWQWPERNHGSTGLQIIQAFDRQCQLLPGFRHGLVRKDLLYVQPEEHCHSDILMIEVLTVNIKKPFVLQGYKIQKELSTTPCFLDKTMQTVSDLYEVQTWVGQVYELRLVVKLNRCINPNQLAEVTCVENCTGTVTEQKSMAQKVVVLLKIQPNGPCKFIICCKERIEKLRISKNGCHLTPSVLPGLDIQVPSQAVAKDVNLLLKVIGTKDLKLMDGKPLFMSDVVCLSSPLICMKEIEVTVPEWSSEEADRIVVIAADKDTDDLKVIEHKQSNKGTITICTPSFYKLFVVSKPVLDSLTLLFFHDLLQKLLEYKRTVQIIIVSKKTAEDEDHFVMIVHCVLFNLVEDAKEHWIQKGYHIHGVSNHWCCNVNSIFKISLSGNLKEFYHTGKLDLDFYLFRENIRLLTVAVVDVDKSPVGTLKIQQVLNKDGVEIVDKSKLGCTLCGGTRPKTAVMETLVPVYSCDIDQGYSTMESLEHIENKPEGSPLRKIFDGFRLIRVGIPRKVHPT